VYFRGFGTGIYTTNSPEACLYCATKSYADIIVVEDKKQLDKILSIKDRLPELKAIVQYSGKPVVEGVISVRNICNTDCSKFLFMLLCWQCVALL
jgi:long-chain-fatty-acid--CoA ligase ACSBG